MSSPGKSEEPSPPETAAERLLEEQFRLMVEGVKDYAIFMLDPAGKVATWNQGAQRIKGYRASEIIGQGLDRFYTAEDRAAGRPQRNLREAAANGRIEDQGWRVRKDGTIFFADVVLTALRDRSGKLVGFSKVTRDVSERRRAEAEIAARDAQLESARLKSLFLATMSHEIRTPLHIMLTYTHIIERHLARTGDRSQARAMEGIRRAGERLEETIDRILDLSRIESGAFEIKREPLDAPAMVAKLVEDFRPLAKEKGLQLLWNTSEPSAVIEFDEYCLTRAVSNLLENAIKFTDSGGIGVRFFTTADGRKMLEVSDTGVGIAADFLARLFEPFSQEESGYSRRFQGTGLGLALVKRYLAMNEAEISVTSDKGSGTAFLIRFAPQPGAPAAAIMAQPPGIPKILLVEDDPDSREACAAILSERYEVIVAGSAEQARRELDRWGDSVSIALVDLSLAHAEDGLAVARYVRGKSRLASIPMIAVTAHAFSEDQSRAMEAGCTDFLSKPFDADDLFAMIERHRRHP